MKRNGSSIKLTDEEQKELWFLQWELLNNEMNPNNHKRLEELQKKDSEWRKSAP